MAVQAQYPSNVLLLNRSEQEGHQFSLPQQGGGVFLDQSHMFFNNGSNNNTINNNPRKRGREVAVAAITAPRNSFSLQAQPPQLIDLSQLHRPNVVSTGLHLSFGDQRQNLQQNQNLNQSYEHQNQNLFSNSSAFLSIISDDLGTQLKRQREELDQFLQAQGEELRRTLVEKRHRHDRALLGALEESLARRLREKEAEVEKAKRQNAELEARVGQLSVESKVWQAKARAQEATAASLQAQLQQAIISGGAAATQDSWGGEERLKCAGGVKGQAEDAESAYVDPERVVATSGPACKVCRKRVASVVLLPCRHLCLCTEWCSDHIFHALQSYSGLLESLDAVNMNLDALHNIERFLLQPGIEKIVLGRHRSLERRPPWRSLFVQSGFSPMTFSNFTESQAECLIQRTLIRGFHVEKRQSSLVLCWQRRELIAASAWRC